MFAVAFLFLTVQPEFYLPQEEFDLKFCEWQFNDLGLLVKVHNQYRDTFADLPAGSESAARYSMYLAKLAARIDPARAALNEARAAQRGKMLRGDVVTGPFRGPRITLP